MVNSNSTSMINPLAVAYEAGRVALDEGRISDGARTLYEWCVRVSSGRSYVWAGLGYLAEKMRCCTKTVSRRFDELIVAGLVVRRRRINHTWLTWITALGTPEEAVQESLLSTNVRTVETPMSAPPLTDQNTDQGGGSLALGEVIEGEPDAASSAELAAELRDAGLVDDRTIRELAAKPAELVRRAVAYVKRSGPVRCGPGLIAWLVRNEIVPRAGSAPKRGAPSGINPFVEQSRRKLADLIKENQARGGDAQDDEQPVRVKLADLIKANQEACRHGGRDNA